VFRKNAAVKRKHVSNQQNGQSNVGIQFSKSRSELAEEDDEDDDNVRLLRPSNSDDPDLESGTHDNQAVAPPPYVSRVEALQYSLSRLEARIGELDVAHKNHLARPTLDDNPKEEEEIRHMTKEISQMFGSCHQQVKSVRRSFLTYNGGPEAVLTQNLSAYLVNRLQEATQTFSQSQSGYLKKIKSREEKSQLIDFGDDELTCSEGGFLGEEQQQVWSKADVFLLDENSKFVQQREREIQSVVKSISDLNVIFKELAVMISEQGQVIDRIDHSIENTSLKVEAGLNELKQADRYQKKNRKMKCIVIEAVIVVVLLFILIITKT